MAITASHNPWVDNGFKVKAPTEAAAGPEMLAVIESRLAENGTHEVERRPFADAEAAGLVERFDPYDGYERFVRRTLDLDALRAADVSVLVDPLWGSGSGWISRLLAGGRIRVTEIHQERNPYFGGVNPEPIHPNVDEGLARLVADGLDLGLLLDGDADRAGAADEHGTFIHQLQVTGLLMYYLAEHRGLRDPVVVSVNNTSSAARLGEHLGIATHEVPVGFKFIGPKTIETGAMMGAEESGGYGFGMHLPERDGIYADLLLLDLFLREKARGVWPVPDPRDLPRARGAVVVPAGRRPCRAPAVRGREQRLLVDLVATPRPRSPASRSPGRRRCPPTTASSSSSPMAVAADPGVGYRAAGPGLHRGLQRGDARRAAGPGRAAGARHVNDAGLDGSRRVPKPWGTSRSGRSPTGIAASCWSSRLASVCRSRSTWRRTSRSTS